jgi:HD-like signal output (HDOD) protein
MDLVRDDHLDYATAEQQVYGFAHPLIGALVAKKWNFSSESCQIILHYRDPLESSKAETELEEKTAVVQIGEMIAHAAGIGSPEGYPNQIESIVQVAKFVGFADANIETTIEELINEVKAQFEKERHVYE